MSYYFHTIPQNIALMLRDKHHLDVFVETGTYYGWSSQWASSRFAYVHTVEQMPDYYKTAEFKLLNLPNVFMYLNDSRVELPNIMNYIGNEGTLFYLDAHWSEGAIYGRPKEESSALDEIYLINQWDNRKHAIIVDDAHKFGTPGWPKKEEIIDALGNGGRRTVRELLDVLIAVPNPIIENFRFRRKYIDTYIDAPSVKFFSG